MKAAIAQCPVISDVEIQSPPKVRRISQEEAPVKTAAQATGYAAKFAVIIAGIVMTYLLIHYGQIFQNYLKW